MSAHKYDDLYNYLAAFKNDSPQEIALYLGELGQKRFDSFVEGVAPLIFVEGFENESVFNFAVDSTLEGGSFPCTAHDCREKNLYDLAKFSALYADKVLIHCPIESAFENAHDDFVSVDELAFGIYLTLRLENIVKAGIVGFVSNYVPLCNHCLARQIELESKAENLISDFWNNLIDQFCASTVCTLKIARDGALYVAINGMDAYGSQEGVDIDFIKIPPVYKSLFKKHGETILDKDMLTRGGVLAFLIPLLSDSFTALTNSYFTGGSYLTTRPAQIRFLESAALTIDSQRKQMDSFRQLSCSFPIVQNASIKSILDFRARNEESFAVFRDTITKGLKGKPIDSSTISELKTELIDPEINKINLAMKNNRARLITSTGIEAAIGIASFALGQYGIVSPAEAMTIFGAAGAGSVATQVVNHLQAANVKNNSMYFLWELDRKSH